MAIKITKQLIERMRKKAQKCECRYKVIVAAFDKRDELLGIVSAYPRMAKQHGSVHAEMYALDRWGTTIGTLLLTRFSGKSCQHIVKIDPCSTCESVLTELKINVIVYTGE